MRCNHCDYDLCDSCVDVVAIRQRLSRFYGMYDPSKTCDVDKIAEAYKGREKELFSVLTVKYGPEPAVPVTEAAAPSIIGEADTVMLHQVSTADISPGDPNENREVRLRRFLRCYAPEKLPLVQEILAKYSSDVRLFEVLVSKFGPEPLPPSALDADGHAVGSDVDEVTTAGCLEGVALYTETKYRGLLSNQRVLRRCCESCQAVLEPEAWLNCNDCSSALCASCCQLHDKSHTMTYMGIFALEIGSIVYVHNWRKKGNEAPCAPWYGMVHAVDFETFLVSASKLRNPRDTSSEPTEAVELVPFDAITKVQRKAPAPARTAAAISAAATSQGSLKTKLELPPLSDDSEMDEINGGINFAPPSGVYQLPPSQPSREVFDCGNFLSKFRVPLAVLGAIGLILILVLVPLSFQYVSINEWAFKKDTKTNSVDLSTVFGTGRYSWGVGFTTVAFPSTLQMVYMAGANDDLDVFTDSGQTVSIGVIFRYRLNRTLLAKMYSTFGLNYHQRVLAVSKASMRNAVTNYSVADYTMSRANISTTLFNALQVALESSAFVSVEKEHFTLQYVLLPDVVMQQRVNVFEKTQVQQTNAYTYQASLYRLATAQLVQAVQNNATLVRSQANLEAERMVAQARARAFQDVETESGRQLAAMVAALGVSANMTGDLVLLNNLLDTQGDANFTLLSGVSSALLQRS
jgi:hypothetical protein